MQDSNTREQLRQVYQQDDSGQKMFIPAKSKDIYGCKNIN